MSTFALPSPSDAARIAEHINPDDSSVHQQMEEASSCGGPFCIILSPPEYSTNWVLDRDGARELAISLLQWAQEADRAELEDSNGLAS